jgi:hypothetical protein
VEPSPVPRPPGLAAWRTAVQAAKPRCGAMAIMLTGGFRRGAAMVAALASGSVHVIGLGRPFATDPHLIPSLLAAGRCAGRMPPPSPSPTHPRLPPARTLTDRCVLPLVCRERSRGTCSPAANG